MAGNPQDYDSVNSRDGRAIMSAAQPTIASAPNPDVISTPNRLSNILAAFALVLFSFQGWETASYVS
jgi:hypothetical protein